jgi:hypothetical protein
MTLIATVLTSTFSLQVSDRRITSGGKAWDSENKAICASSSDGVFSIACTGRAYLDNRRIDLWVATVIGDMPVENFTTENIIQTLCRELNELFVKLPPETASDELTLVISGFDGTGSFLATVSNFWTPRGPRQIPLLPFAITKQHARIVDGSGPVIFACCGAEWGCHPRPQRLMRIAVKRGWFTFRVDRDVDMFERRIVQFVQHGSRHYSTVGRSCLAVMLADTQPIYARCTSYAPDGHTSLFIPQVVTEHVAMHDWDISINGSIIHPEGMLKVRKFHNDGIDLVGLRPTESGVFARIGNAFDIALPPRLACDKTLIGPVME